MAIWSPLGIKHGPAVVAGRFPNSMEERAGNIKRIFQKAPDVDASHQVLPDPRLTAFQGQVAEGEGERKEKAGSQMKAGKIHMRGFSEWASGGF